ncbi:MAG: hypothetical protein R3D33_02075 [Hyphomicrobiaceae bacterium]
MVILTAELGDRHVLRPLLARSSATGSRSSPGEVIDGEALEAGSGGAHHQPAALGRLDDPCLLRIGLELLHAVREHDRLASRIDRRRQPGIDPDGERLALGAETECREEAIGCGIAGDHHQQAEDGQHQRA